MNAGLASVATFPWVQVMSSFVAIAGIAGTLLSGHLASKKAEKGRLAQQRHEDRTRFHKERVETYTRFIGAAKAYRESLINRRIGLPALSDANSFYENPSRPSARATLAELRETVLLIADDHVAKIAEKIFGAIIALENEQMTEATFDGWDQVALTALADFRQAARAELQPERND